MNKKELNESFELIKPTQEQKDRMLKNILKADVSHPKPSNILFYKVKPLLYLAASIVILIGIGVNLNSENITTPPASSPPEISYEQPEALYNVIAYNGYPYTILENVSQSIDTLSLTKVLETIKAQDNISLDLDEANMNKQDIIIWESANYHPDDRIVIQQGDEYYICENREYSE